MKNLVNFKLFSLLALLIATFSSSCTKESVAPARDQFLGTYNANADCGSVNIGFASTITKSSIDDNTIVISNFGNFNVNVRATVSGENINFNDTQQGVTFSGSGNINGKTLTIIYTASLGSDRINCTKTCIKQ